MSEDNEVQMLYNCSGVVLGRDVVQKMNRSELLNAIAAVVTADQTNKARQFLTQCLFLEPAPPPNDDIIWWEKLIWIALFASMLIVATTGNAIVMWIVLGKLERFHLMLFSLNFQKIIDVLNFKIIFRFLSSTYARKRNI
ncbi:hypothetical protein O3M35_009048 [Rhynocoris fuscipes]|uniref:Uncharacterized protein n=1 Tax=Rhynocoris fuscipes TaxID=488301 RepID=A0AAW1D3T0_9HEMI